MTLPFLEKINGKDAFFDEKIHKMLIQTGTYTELEIVQFALKNGGYRMPKFEQTPKLHTIREDKNDRWKVGMKVHPVYNNRTKDRYQFAPTFECKGIQRIEIIHFKMTIPQGLVKVWIKIDGKLFYDIDDTLIENLKLLAKNDGFKSIDEFFGYFNKDFKGKIIHFTDLKY